jgi:O-acetyl-ADP-ribose deacetylase (regulator of RNase III)
MIEIIEGNLLESDCTFICHQTNCKRAMGMGIAGQIRQKWPEVYEWYCAFIDEKYQSGQINKSSDLLGEICTQHVLVPKGGFCRNLFVVNFFSQDEYYPRNKCHTDYDAFRRCCKRLKETIKALKPFNSYTIGFPYKIGCGLAGGDWNIVYNIIEDEFKDYNVRIYKYNETKNN